MADLTSLNKQLSRAKITLLNKPSAVFLAYAILQVPCSFSDNVPTAATDGLKILINPEFFGSLSLEQQQFLLAHEVMHIILSHMTRLGNRDKHKFNIAADYVINTNLVEQGFEMIAGGMYDEKYINWSAEQVYDDLPDDDSSSKSNSNNHGQTTDGIGNQDIIYSDDKEIETIRQQTTQIAVQAAIQASMQHASSSIPDSVQRLLEELTAPKVNWRTVLRKYFFEMAKADYSWQRPNRRLLTHGIYLPALQGTQLSKISFAIDTSGSVSSSQFNEFISEVVAVFKLLKPQQLDIIQFDDSLQDHRTVKSLQGFTTLPFKGCGGTCPEVALDAFIKTNSKALFVLTDGCFNIDNLPKPKQPVIWVIFDNPCFIAPFGSVIHVKSTTHP
ncbi:VWA-like domain-containing protein [Moraxella sp. ZJ142]|uniref:vWA domain-containing protein n=1 Tax=Moraxella marmotae TaxID=3344520 RepID=UPI0035D42541